MALEVTLQELIQAALDSRAGEIYTSLPGRIETYDSSTQCADITPLLRRPIPNVSGDISNEDLPVVPNVMILFPRGGGFTVSWPMNKGDIVALIVTTYAMAAWRNSGQVSDPGDIRMHGLGSAFAIPGLYPNSGALDPSQAGQNAFIIAGPMVVLGDPAATDFASLASKVDAGFAKIKALFDGWTPVPNDGGAALKTASASLNFEPTACAKVKIK